VNDKDYIRWFSDSRVVMWRWWRQDRLAGRALQRAFREGVKVPMVSRSLSSYRDALTARRMGPLHQLLDGLDKSDVDLLAERATARASSFMSHRRRGAAPPISAAYRT